MCHCLLTHSVVLCTVCSLPVSVDADRRLHPRCADSGQPTTTVAPSGECLELRGRGGRQPDVAVGHSVCRVDGERRQCPVNVLCWSFVVCELRAVSCMSGRLAMRQRAAAVAALIHRAYRNRCFPPTSMQWRRQDLAPCGAGAPLFPLVHLLPHLFPLFTFLFLSLALLIFFFCPSLPILPE